MEAAAGITGLSIETLTTVATHDHRVEKGLHRLGHGSHAAQSGFRYLDRPFRICFSSRELHEAGHRSLSDARSQQRAGCE